MLTSMIQGLIEEGITYNKNHWKISVNPVQGYGMTTGINNPSETVETMEGYIPFGEWFRRADYPKLEDYTGPAWFLEIRGDSFFLHYDKKWANQLVAGSDQQW